MYLRDLKYTEKFMIPRGQNGRVNYQQKYYNTLYIEGFSRMVKDPSYCYKFYWLEAIVWLISENKKEATYNEIIDEMIANAWYSILEFHVHLSGLPPNASKTEIKNQIHKFDKNLHVEKMELTQNVPIKALSRFANAGVDKINLRNRNNQKVV